MADRTSILVTPVEKKILASLRELPEGPLREELQGFLLALTDFVRDPRCAEVQADGIPCGSAQADCAQCQEVLGLVETLRRKLPVNV